MMATFPGFELWRQPPDREVVVLGILKNGRVALERPRRRRPRGDGKLPVEQVSSRLETPIHTAVRLRERIGLPVTDPRLVASFDELDFRTRQRTRRHLFACELRAGKSGRHTSSRDDVHWLRVNQLSKSHDNSRTIAYLKRYVTSPNSHSLGH